MQSTTATRRAPSRGAKTWLGCTFLYLLASAPLAHAADARIEQTSRTCVACHGPNGQSSDPTVPSLAGQTSRYVYEELRDFQAGRRHSVNMTPIAKTLSYDDMQKLADYFSQQTPMSSSSAAIDDAKVVQGRSIADNSPCVTCHDAGLTGQSETPRIAGQQYAYIVKALQSFRDGRRTNDGGAMQAVVHGVSDQNLEALAQYITNLN
jgi:cytochrome c553